MPDVVTIDRDRLAELLWFAQRGDVANSQRRWSHRFRRAASCSDPDGREDGCYSCQTFAAAEFALGSE